MKSFSRWTMIGFCLIAAIVCYLVGSVVGLGFFILLGVLFELMFWIKLFRKP